VSPLALGPILALLGLVAAFYILRRKAKTRKSMYRTLREQREHDLRKARARATAAKAASETAAIQKEQDEPGSRRARRRRRRGSAHRPGIHGHDRAHRSGG